MPLGGTCGAMLELCLCSDWVGWVAGWPSVGAPIKSPASGVERSKIGTVCCLTLGTSEVENWHCWMSEISLGDWQVPPSMIVLQRAG